MIEDGCIYIYIYIFVLREREMEREMEWYLLLFAGLPFNEFVLELRF